MSNPDRLHLTWALYWPLAAFDLLVWLSANFFNLSKNMDSIQFFVSAFQLFLLAPWVIRRAMGLNFPQSHLVAIRRQGGEETRTLKYRESLSVAWLLAWRGGLIVLAFIAPVAIAFFLLRGTHAQLPFDAKTPGFGGLLWGIGGHALVFLVYVLWLVPAALNKQYEHFSLRLAPQQAGEN